MTLASLEALSDADRKNTLLLVDRLLSELVTVVLPSVLASRFRQGQRISLQREGVDFPADYYGRIRVIDDGQALLGVAQLSPEGVLQPERLISN